MFYRLRKDEKGINNTQILITIGSIILVIVLVLGITVISLKKSNKANKQETDNNIASTTDQEQILKNNLPGTAGDIDANSLAGKEIQAEKMTFADFYKPIEDTVEAKNKLALPLNVKSDTVNYYDIARVMPLDKYLDSLDKKGFAVIDNPFGDEARDFYSAYAALNKRGVPLLLTSDFLMYYYQNSLKEIYSNIKSNIFYTELWRVNKQMFDIAERRYRTRKYKYMGVNDPVLEAERLETAYFAVALELLKPRAEQIDVANGSDPNRFDPTQISEFNYPLPEYLSDIVLKETGKIMAAQDQGVSPVFLYPIDYRNYSVSGIDKKNAKQQNFSMAIKWMNSIFPLYYKNATSCPDCLLDKDDWMVANMAAYLIADDFSANQGIKNQWAKIYKVISFFQGLRQDLSYRHYHDALVNAFGDKYDLEELFTTDRTATEANLTKLQSEVLKNSFAAIEGGYPRNDIRFKKSIGMRMLQDPYWPDSYLFEQLTYPYVGYYTGGSTDKTVNKNILLNNTYCTEIDKSMRCKGTGLDIVNLVSPSIASKPQFIENSKYEKYGLQTSWLKNEIGHFTLSSWKNNGFWSTLDLAKSIFMPQTKYADISLLADKNLNMFLGSWVNLQLPQDQLEHKGVAEANSDVSKGKNYIEPNIELIDDIFGNTQMLQNALVTFRAVGEADSAIFKLNDINKDLARMREIAKEELSNQELNYEDSKAILDIVQKFSVVELSKDKSIFFQSAAKKRIRTEESISGIKMMIMVYAQDGKKYLVIGPLFNYKEN